MTRRRQSPAAGTDQPSPDSGRRRLLNALWLGAGCLAVAETAWLVSAFLKTVPSGGSTTTVETLLDVGPVSRFAPATVTAFPRGGFYLACLADGGFLALSRRCTHLGCTVPWDAQTQQFACPCHASVFDIRGAVIQSPAPRPLDRFIVTVENGRVKVDVGQPIRRSRFTPDEVVYA